MNLVAKEFVAARDDEDGVLILSTFAGASRELVEAMLVNPFDVAETAAAIRRALEMPREQRRAAHAADAAHDQGEQRLSLGRAHAHRCGAHPPAAGAVRSMRTHAVELIYGGREDIGARNGEREGR